MILGGILIVDVGGYIVPDYDGYVSKRILVYT